MMPAEYPQGPTSFSYDSESENSNDGEEELRDYDDELETRYYIPGKNKGTTFTMAPIIRSCPICEKSYRGVHDLRVHYRRHINSFPYCCTYPNCEKPEWLDGKKLNNHIRRKHLNEKSANKKNRSLKGRGDNEAVNKWIQIQKDVLDAESDILGIGNTVYEDRLDRRQIVLKVVHKDDEEDDDDEDAKDDQPPFTVIHQTSEGQYICPFEHCDNVSNEMSGLKNHYRKKHAPKKRSRPYRCTFNREVCQFSSTNMSMLKTHVRVVHFREVEQLMGDTDDGGTIELCCIEVVTKWLKLEDQLFRQATIVPVREERMNLVPVQLKPVNFHQQNQQQQQTSSSTTTSASFYSPGSVTLEKGPQKVETILPYACPFAGCIKAYQRSSQLNFHLRNNLDHNRPLVQPFYCTFPGEKSCKFADANKATVLGHIATAHFGVPTEQLAKLTAAERRRDEGYLGFRVNTLKKELEEAELKARAEKHQLELTRQQRKLLLLQQEDSSNSNFGYESLSTVYWSSTSKEAQVELTEKLDRGLKSPKSSAEEDKSE